MSIYKAQKTFAMDGDESIFDKTLASGKGFIKLLATEKKLSKKQHNNKQKSLEICLNHLYLVMRFTAKIVAAKV